MAKGAKFKRICTICGREYEYCTRGCNKFSHMEPWHDAYDVENCKDLYNVTAGYINHWLDPDIEVARLQKLDLSYKDKLPKWMQDAINEMQKKEVHNAAAINQALDEKKEEAVEVEKIEKVEKDVTVKNTSPAFKHQDKKQDAQNKYKPNRLDK